MPVRARSRMALTRQPAVWVGICVLGVVLLAGSTFALRFGAAHAASIGVTDCSQFGHSGDGGGTLYDALENPVPVSGATIQFTCNGSITIPASQDAFTAPITVSDTLTFDAHGQTVALSGGGSQQIFTVTGTGNLTLNDLTLANGASSFGGAILNSGILSITGSTLGGNAASGNGGGAIYQNPTGTLTITDSTFTHNTSTNAFGGAIYNAGGTITITGSTFTSNATVGGPADDGRGGAIYSTGTTGHLGTLTISGSYFSANSASGGAGDATDPGGIGAGGAIDAGTGVVSISDSTFSGNTATGGVGGASGTSSPGTTGGDAGGGALNFLIGASGATVTLSDSTFSDNSATGGAGGPNDGSIAAGSNIAFGTGGNGFGGALSLSGGGVGGIADPSKSGGGVGGLQINANTLTANKASGGGVGGAVGSGSGGALYASGGGVGGIAPRFTGLSVTSSVASNIIFDNTVAGGASSTGPNCDSLLTDDGYNLTNTGDSGCGFSLANNDVFTTDAKLGTLGNNGGSAPTIYLGTGSPAINAIPAGASTGCGQAGDPLAADERGVSRPQPSGGNCDIGAYELAPDTVTHLTASPTTANEGQSVQLCATVAGTVSGTGTPTGTVTFKDGGSTIGTGTLVNGTVCITTTTLSLGTHSITASYGGDPQFNPSVSAAVKVTVGVNGADVAGASGGNSGAQASNGGAAGNAGGASGQQAQGASTSGSGTIASSTPRAGVSGGWPVSLALWLGVLLLLVGLSGLGTVLVRAARR